MMKDFNVFQRYLFLEYGYNRQFYGKNMKNFVEFRRCSFSRKQV